MRARFHDFTGRESHRVTMRLALSREAVPAAGGGRWGWLVIGVCFSLVIDLAHRLWEMVDGLPLQPECTPCLLAVIVIMAALAAVGGVLAMEKAWQWSWRRGGRRRGS